MLKTIDHGRVLELRLDRPPVNALNPALVANLTSAVRAAAVSSDALIISGREGLFSAGLDVPELLQLDRAGMAEFWTGFFGLLEAVARSPIPVVAAVTGHAPAGGAVLSLFCDYRVMSRGEYRIGLNETLVGLIVPDIIRRALERLTGPHRAERLIVAGTLLNPEKAYEAGMIDALSEDPASAVTGALDWCNRLLGLPGHAMLGNRNRARQDLHSQFDTLDDTAVESFVSGWFEESTQQTLHALVAQLKAKK
jgi:enoyl-CoA hydratase/carnithine racemase